jgi:hypothetical protein
MDDLRRRAAEAAAESEAEAQRAAAVAGALVHAIDELGITVAPAAELSEPDLLRPYVVRAIDGELPAGLPSALAATLQGKRVDVVVPVEFLSEVFIDRVPLSKPTFEAQAQPLTLDGHELRELEVLAPRVGPGRLIALGGRRVFISRPPGLPLPGALVLQLLTSAT